MATLPSSAVPSAPPNSVLVSVIGGAAPLRSGNPASTVPDPDEIAELQWTDPGGLDAAVAAAPWALSPWLLDGASPQDVSRVLDELPGPLRLVHRFWWNPRYRKARRWQ